MESGEGTVLVVGVFDLFHEGHVRLLERARAFGSRLVVIVNGDALTTAYKRKPIMSESERLAVVRACRYVDEAFVSNEFSIRPYIPEYGVRSIVHGDEWDMESYKRQIRCDDAFLEEHGAKLVFLPYTPGVSTSDIIERCAAAKARRATA